MLEEARKTNRLWENDIKQIMKEMDIDIDDFQFSEEWIKYHITEKAKLLMEVDLNKKAYKENDEKKLMINYIIDSKNESIRFNKTFTNELKKKMK